MPGKHDVLHPKIQEKNKAHTIVKGLPSLSTRAFRAWLGDTLFQWPCLTSGTH